MQNNKPHINLVVIGKQQSGKSTSIGHLLFQLGEIKKDAFQQYFQKNIRQEKYAWVMAQHLQEEYLEETMLSNYKKFETNNYLYTIIDTPGRKKYLKQLITGVSLADIGLVFVTSVNGEGGFEKGIQDNEIREHILLAYSLGLRQLICCINKMDENSVLYSQDRYNQIANIMKDQFKNIGYNPEKISFIPISGLLGYNLIEKSQNLSWYKGPTLLEALNLIHPPKRSIHKPLRISILKILQKKQTGTLVLGKVVSGVLTPGMIVKCCPSQATLKVESMEMHLQQMNQAVPGDNISIGFNEQICKQILEGYICSDQNYEPAKTCLSFEAQITIVFHPNPILYCHSAHAPCRFQNFIRKIDSETNKILEQNPTFLKTGDTALVKLVPLLQICLETHTEFSRLSKFVMYEGHELIAIGIIKTVDK